MTFGALILTALFNTPDCPDSPEPGRACRYCEAEEVRKALADAMTKAVAK